jgi:NAD+-dependent protein deacetylase SIR2
MSNFISELKIPQPESIFDLFYFEKNPQPFYSFAKEYLSVDRNPAPSHYLMKILETKN